MRMARIKAKGSKAVYHCMSRVVGGQRLLGDVEKEVMRKMLWKQAAFCGVEVITYCLLWNHFHVVVRVPWSPEVGDEELVKRVVAFYGKRKMLAQRVMVEWERNGRLPLDLREGLLRRMGDVSVFMKEFKQRFSRWFNRHRGERYGTLWAERFKSVLVEDESEGVEAVAVYVDLNSVRAGLGSDPGQYRWCGYGEAQGGSELARKGLMGIKGRRPGVSWGEVSREYRERLLVTSAQAKQGGKVVLEPEAIRGMLKQGAVLEMGQVLRLRVRYFSDGVVLGSRAFVEGVFGEYRERFGSRRKNGARAMRGLKALGGLMTLRDLRKRAVG